MNIYERIKELCLENGNLHICDLEKQLKLPKNSLSKWAKSSPRIDKLFKVSSYFNVSLDYMVGRTVMGKITNINDIIANGSASDSSDNSNNSFPKK